MENPALPPETLEGWYVLHQVFSADTALLRTEDENRREPLRTEAAETLTGLQPRDGVGWSMVVELIGSKADMMFVHFRPTLEGISDVERRVKVLASGMRLTPRYNFLSVTEAGLYHVTAQLARQAQERGGQTGDEEYRTALSQRVAAEL
jgi:chlorite dismutase